MGKLAENVVLVTGAGRGIGQAIALACVSEGAGVALLARSQDQLGKTAQRIHAQGGRALIVSADVTVPDEVARCHEQVKAEFGRVDVLVNNAGRQSPIGPLVECDHQDWARTIMVNLAGTAMCCQAVLPGMIERGRGKIINFSGGGATGPRANFSAYAASKAAIVRLTETLAEEVKPYGIDVNAVAPGAINTSMTDEVLDAGPSAGESELQQSRRQKIDGGGSLQLVTELVVFLASSDSDGLTGKLISAPHDPWREWAGRGPELSATPMYTLRRLDPYTLRPLIPLGS